MSWFGPVLWYQTDISSSHLSPQLSSKSCGCFIYRDLLFKFYFHYIILKTNNMKEAMSNHKLCMNKINQNKKKNRKEEKSKPKRKPAMSYPFFSPTSWNLTPNQYISSYPFPPPPEISLQTSTSPAVTLFPTLHETSLPTSTSCISCISWLFYDKWLLLVLL